jgi:primosomal protein N' (replication factor Y) (superfamily II helicase)
MTLLPSIWFRICYTQDVTTDLLADVAVRARIFKQPLATYTYLVPAGLRTPIAPGMLVWVPLQRKLVQGVILALREGWSAADGERSPPSRFVVRPIEDLGDPEAQLPPHALVLARWIAEYYRVPLWEALALHLPPGVAQESLLTWRPSAQGLAAELASLPPAEREMLFFLQRHGETTEPALHEALRARPTELRRVAQTLNQRGLIRRSTELSRPAVRVKEQRTARLLVEPGHYDEALHSLEKAPRQQEALRTLIERHVGYDGEPMPAQDVALPALRGLEARQFVALGRAEVLRNPLDGSSVQRDMPPPLTDDQARALAPIVEQIDRGTHGVFLLHGVTGSGKTELYLRAIARAMRHGHQTLVLVPEIALTAQLLQRFAARFGDAVAVLHSELSLGERYDTWRRLRRGDVRIVVGSRSAIFAPASELGLVIVDEEHDGSYKHAEGVRYQARDVAVRLGAMTGSVVILGSATPAIESYHAAREGHYRLLELHDRVAPSRHGGSRSIPLPSVQVVDMRQELRGGNRSLFSRALQHALETTLDAGEQVILFLNRRGLASLIMCRDCGHVVTCVRCSSPLVLHHVGTAEGGTHREDDPLYDTLLRCHTCGYRELPPAQCPSCWSARIRQFGVGTQRVVEEMRTFFPRARVIRWDRDVTGRKGSHERLLKAFTNHEADVIVGTQMIAKGLDLPLVTLVGIVSADTGLHLPDFRSGERTFQLLAQVAGRAGRRERGGKVVLQSYTPEHYAIQAAANHDYRGFFGEEIAFRRLAHYPPFGQLVRFVCAAGSARQAQQNAETLAKRIEEEIAALKLDDASIIGPAPAFSERIRDRYRWHLFVRAPAVHPLLEALGPLPGWMIDVDPVSML